MADGKYRPAHELVDGRYERCGRTNFTPPADQDAVHASTAPEEHVRACSCVFANRKVMAGLAVSIVLGVFLGRLSRS
jgi:hypothetical protein